MPMPDKRDRVASIQIRRDILFLAGEFLSQNKALPDFYTPTIFLSVSGSCDTPMYLSLLTETDKNFRAKICCCSAAVSRRLQDTSATLQDTMYSLCNTFEWTEVKMSD